MDVVKGKNLMQFFTTPHQEKPFLIEPPLVLPGVLLPTSLSREID
jgi:hypothetical protein